MKLISIHIICIFLISSSHLSAQLAGNKYIPGDYATIAEAVDSLNFYGVGLGGVTFNIQAGYIESDEIEPITATGTVSSPIVFQKVGIGDNPKIYYPAQITNVAFQLMGSDYVTIDGITFENLYVGVAFFQQGGNDGCLYNEIKNCEFINTKFLLWSYRNTIAMDIESTHSFNQINNNEYYSAGVASGSTAIYFFSADGNQSISDQGNEIGVEGGNLFSYQNTNGTIWVADINHQKSLSFENNLITCDNHNGAFYGITSFGITFPPFLQYIGSDKVSIQNNVFNLNNITNANPVTPISIACAQSLYDSVLVIGNSVTGTNINSTSFRGIRVTDVSSECFVVADNSIENLTTTTEIGNFTAIDFIFGSGSNYLIRNNTVNNIQDSGNSLFSGIKIGLGDGRYDIFENEISTIGKSNLSLGDLQGFVLNTGEVTLTNNNIQNFNHQGEGNIYGIKGSDSLVSESIQNNQIYDLVSSNGNSIGISNEGYAENSTISDNQIFNFIGSGLVAGFSFDNQNHSGTRNILENEVYNLASDSSVVALRVGGGENGVNDNHFYALEVTQVTSTGDLSGIHFDKGEITLTNNSIHNFNHQGIGNLFGIQGTDTTTLETIENNQIYDLTSSNGNIYGISANSFSANSTIRENEIHNLSGFGSVAGFSFDNQNPLGIRNILENEVYNLASDSSVIALRVGGGENGVNNNHFYALEVAEPTSTGNLSGIHFDKGEITLTNNILHNFNHQGIGNLFGIQGTDTTTLEIIENNQVYDLTSLNGSTYGVNSTSISNSRIILTNEIYNLSAYDNVIGVAFENSNTHFHRNKIHTLQSESINGKTKGVEFVLADAVFVSNNLIGNLTAPNSNDLNGVNGIMIDTLNFASIYYNSIVLAAENSSGDFGSSAIFIGEVSEGIALRNNIFINKSEANGSGMTVALRMGDDDLNILSPSNDNNLYFVDTLTSNAAIYHDGTNTDVSLSSFKQRMDIREQSSVTEDVVFESLNGTSTNFLRPSNAVPTFVESHAQEISGYEDDYHFLGIRSNYPQAGQANGGGEQPDIGAIEGDYLPIISSINEQGIENIEVTIFPNPTVDEITIQFLNAKDAEYEVTITDGQGNIVLNRTYTTNFVKIDAREYASGVYFVGVNIDNFEINKKIVLL